MARCTRPWSGTCSWCASASRRPRWTRSWCTPTPRPTTWARWTPLCTARTRPTCRQWETGAGACPRRGAPAAGTALRCALAVPPLHPPPFPPGAPPHTCFPFLGACPPVLLAHQLWCQPLLPLPPPRCSLQVLRGGPVRGRPPAVRPHPQLGPPGQHARAPAPLPGGGRRRQESQQRQDLEGGGWGLGAGGWGGRAGGRATAPRLGSSWSLGMGEGGGQEVPV